MNIRSLLALSILVLAALIGCSSSEGTAEQNATQTTSGTVANAEKAKCGECGKEVAQAELASHDGKMLCKECIAAHGH